MGDEAEAEPEPEPVPTLSFAVEVSEGKNLRQLVPVPSVPEDQPEEETAAWVPKVAVLVQAPDSDSAKSDAVLFEGEDCAFGFNTGFEKLREDSLFNHLCTTPLELKLLDGADVDEGAEPAVLGTFTVNFDALLNGELQYTSWYHVKPLSPPTEIPENHPEIRVTIKVSELMQTPLGALESTIMTLGVDQGFQLPTACMISDGSEEPSPADICRFGIKLTVPTTGAEDADLVSLEGTVAREASYVPPAAAPEEDAEDPAKDAMEAETEAEAGAGDGGAAPAEEEAEPGTEAGMQSITWNITERAYLTPDGCERMKAMIDAGEGLTFRMWRNNLDADGTVENCEPDWSDVSRPLESGMVNAFVAQGTLSCTELLNSGATVVEGQVHLVAPPVPEPTEDADAAPAKGKGKKTPEPEDAAEGNPFETAGTYINVRIVLTRPIVPELPAPPPMPKPSEIVPPRPRVPRVIAPSSGTEEFKGEIDALLEALLDEYGALSSSKGSASATEMRQQFLFELNSSGKYFTFKEKLKKSVVRIVKERFHKTPAGGQAELETLVNELYVYLVQQMHVCLRTRFDPSALGSETADMGAAATSPTVEKLYTYAAEAEANQQYDLARSYMQDIVCADNSSITGWNAFASFCFRMHDVPKGCECLREAVSIDATDISTLLTYAAVQLSLGDLDAAQAFLHGAAELDSSNSMTWVLLGLLYCMLDRPIDAKSCNLEAKRLGLPAGAESPHMAAWLFCLKLHLTAVAERAVAEEETASGSSFLTFVARGEAAFQRESFDEAEKSLQEALATKGDSFQAWALLGNVYCAQLNRVDDAIAALESAVSSSAPSGAERSKVLLRLGELCISSGKFDRARELYFEVCQEQPTASSWLGLGLSYVGLDELDSAEECFSEANIVNNLNPQVWGHLTLLALRTGRESEATLAYKEALKLGLSDVELLREIGQQQLGLGKMTLAEGTARRALSFAQTESIGATCHQLLGDVLLAQGSLDSAKVSFGLALDANPDSDVLKEKVHNIDTALGIVN